MIREKFDLLSLKYVSRCRFTLNTDWLFSSWCEDLKVLCRYSLILPWRTRRKKSATFCWQSRMKVRPSAWSFLHLHWRLTWTYLLYDFVIGDRSKTNYFYFVVEVSVSSVEGKVVVARSKHNISRHCQVRLFSLSTATILRKLSDFQQRETEKQRRI